MRVFRVPDNRLARSAALNEAGVHVLLHCPPFVRRHIWMSKTDWIRTRRTSSRVPDSLAGLPALSVSTAVGGEGDGWPLGVNVVVKWGCELMVLAAG